MKKQITLFVLAFFCSVGVAKATIIWEGTPVATGSWSGNVQIEASSFTSAANGDIIKVTFSEYYVDETPANNYWQVALKTMSDNWPNLTGADTRSLEKNNPNYSYILTSTNITELQATGLVVGGHYVTISKVELLPAASTTTSNLSSTSTTISGWDNNINLHWVDDADARGDLANAQMNDYIKITFTTAAPPEYNPQVSLRNPANEWNIFDNYCSYSVAHSQGTTFTFLYAISNATTLETIQQEGVIVCGYYITISSVDLVKPAIRYDAVPLTIGSDGIATFGSSKRLDFSGIDAVTPYYASSVASGVVTLTAVDATHEWAGYIVKGTPGYYEVPVTADDPGWLVAFNNLRYSGDYDGNYVYYSLYTDYSGGGDNETNIKTKHRYIFAKNGDNIGFYKLKTYSEGDGTPYHILNRHKAYLETTDDLSTTNPTGAPAIQLVFDEESNATNLENSSPKVGEVPEGQRGMKLIQNGRLLIIRDGITYDVMGRVIR